MSPTRESVSGTSVEHVEKMLVRQLSHTTNIGLCHHICSTVLIQRFIWHQYHLLSTGAVTSRQPRLSVGYGVLLLTISHQHNLLLTQAATHQHNLSPTYKSCPPPTQLVTQPHSLPFTNIFLSHTNTNCHPLTQDKLALTYITCHKLSLATQPVTHNINWHLPIPRVTLTNIHCQSPI